MHVKATSLFNPLLRKDVFVDKSKYRRIIKVDHIFISMWTSSLRGCTGFDRESEVGEAIRSHALNANLNINAEDNLAIAA